MESNKKWTQKAKTEVTIYNMKPYTTHAVEHGTRNKTCINMLNYKLCDYLMATGSSSRFHHKAMPSFKNWAMTEGARISWKEVGDLEWEGEPDQG